MDATLTTATAAPMPSCRQSPYWSTLQTLPSGKCSLLCCPACGTRADCSIALQDPVPWPSTRHPAFSGGRLLCSIDLWALLFLLG